MADILNVTVGELLKNVSKTQPEVEAVVYPDRDLRYTYAQFEEVCRQAAKGFMSLGIEKGDHMAIWGTNKPEWLISQFSTGKMGGVLVTVNTNYRTSELEYLLKQSESSTVILQESFKGSSYVEMLYEIVPELKNAEPGNLKSETLPYLKNVIFLGEERLPGMYTWQDVMEKGDQVTDEALDKRLASLDPHDVINMQYTSGTTGFPKGVMLTHYNITNNGLNIGECMNLSSKDRLCIPVPFFHCFGCVLGTMACVTTGQPWFQ